MLLNKLKYLFKKNTTIEADLPLNEKIKGAVKDMFLPLDHTLAPLVMSKIEENKNRKNNFAYKLNYRIAPIALSILLVFAVTGISMGSPSLSSRNTSLGGYTSAIKNAANPELDTSGETIPSIKTEAPSKIDNTETLETKKKSKIKIFFENIISYIKNILKK